jgi:subtilase family serine protease
VTQLLRACRLFIVSSVAAITALAAQAAGPSPQSAPAATQSVQFELFLPLRHQAELDTLLAQLHDQNSPLYRHWLTPQEFNARFGADPDSIERVQRALQRRGLVVEETGPRSLVVSGPATTVRSGLGLDLRSMQTARGTRVIAARGVALPAELTNEGAVVAAFRSVDVHKRHGRRVALDKDLPQNRYDATGPYWFTDIKQAYDFPSYKALTGKGVTIAIVMANDFLDSDMALYFGHEKLPVPKIVHVPVKGGAPFDPDGSFEVSLDIQQSGGMAPKATIRAYNLPDLSDDSIMRAYNRIVQNNAADIVSSSFGGAELFYTAAYNDGTDFTDILQVYESIFKQGNAQGITFVASSGDSGGLGATTPDYFTGSPTAHFIPGVEHPAVSPHVTAVGGTNLLTTFVAGSLQSRYVGENAYGDPEIPYDPYGIGTNVSGGYWGSGGGESVLFAKPAYQYLVPTHSNMRTVPDVSLQMGGCPGGISQLPCGTPRSASVVAVGGGLFGVIGTSVSAPGFAGLLALFEEALGGRRLGNVNGLLYTEAALQTIDPGLAFFHRNIDGFNGYDYTARIYDRVVGVGTPRVRNMILTPQLPAAGDPQTPSNP